jgi:ABC transporter transmembrane protein
MREVVRGYSLRIALSLVMVLAEAAGAVALPYVLGRAIDDHVNGSNRGVVVLAVVGLATMLLALLRRIHDVRLYSRIYERASEAAVQQEAGLSAKTARLNMLREVIDFLEFSLPDLLASIAVFVGTLAFLFTLNTTVFLAAVVMAALITAIYALSTRRTVVFNQGYNDEYERQVDVLQRNDRVLTRRHIGLLNSWMIKLSDLDATNYAMSMTLAVVLQIFAVTSTASSGADHGTLLSVVLYVFEFSAVAPFVPASWQEYLRLRDILQRLRADTRA